MTLPLPPVLTGHGPVTGPPQADQIAQIQERVSRALRQLIDAGAADPTGVLGPTAPARAVPIHLLDTSANRRLLHALEEAHVAALEVDKERGHADDQGNSDGFAKVIADQAARILTEIYGPADLRQGVSD